MENQAKIVNKIDNSFGVGKMIYLAGALLTILSFMLPIFYRIIVVDRKNVMVQNSLFVWEITSLGFFIVILSILSFGVFYFQVMGKDFPNKFNFIKPNYFQVILVSFLFSYFVILFGLVSIIGASNGSGLFAGSFGSFIMITWSFLILKNIQEIDQLMEVLNVNTSSSKNDPNVNISQNNSTGLESSNNQNQKNVNPNEEEKRKKRKKIYLLVIMIIRIS